MTNVPTEIHKMEEKSQRVERLGQLQETQRTPVTVFHTLPHGRYPICALSCG